MTTTLMSAAASEEMTEAIYKKVTRRLIPLLFLCYVMNFLDRTNIGYAQLQMRSDLGFSDAIYGIGASIFYIGYFIFEVPSNLLLQRIGARLTVLRIMFCWGIVSAATMFVTTPAEFYIVRFFLGVFEAGFFPGVLFYLTFWYPPARRARVVALFMTAVVVAGIISGPVSGWILTNLDEVHGLHGWQWLYLIEGLPSSVLGVIVYFSLPDSPVQAKWLNDAERDVIRADLEAVQRDLGGSNGVVHGGLASALRDPKVYLFCFLYFTISCEAYALSFWTPTLIQELGVPDPQQIGLYALIPNTVGAIAMVWYGRRSDRTNERRWHFAFATFIAAIALVLTTFVDNQIWVSMALLAVTSAGVVSAFPVFWAAATARLSTASAAAGIAMITTLGSLSGVFSPFAIGMLKSTTGSISTALYLVATVVAIGGLVMLCSRTTRSN